MKTDKEMFQKIKNGIDLSENELNELVYYSVKDIEGEDRRWSRGVTSILDIDGETYILNWEKGLTEYQENEFYEQPVKVRIEKKTKVVTMEVTNYIDEKTGKIIEFIEKEIKNG